MTATRAIAPFSNTSAFTLARASVLGDIVPAAQKRDHGPGRYRKLENVGLNIWLTNPHPTMPKLVLYPQEAAAVIAYILSLREQPDQTVPADVSRRYSLGR